MPPGTTSYYFRTRKALLSALAARLTELDLADLSMMEEIEGRSDVTYSGTRGLAELVMLSGTEPYRTRSRARFELILHASQAPELDATITSYGIRFYALARDVVARWYEGRDVAPAAIEERAVMVLTFISGVIVSFVQGYPVVSDADQLDTMIRRILGDP